MERNIGSNMLGGGSNARTLQVMLPLNIPLKIAMPTDVAIDCQFLRPVKVRARRMAEAQASVLGPGYHRRFLRRLSSGGRPGLIDPPGDLAYASRSSATRRQVQEARAKRAEGNQMQRLSLGTAVAIGLAVVAIMAIILTTPRPAEASIHEIIAALCRAGGEEVAAAWTKQGRETRF